MTSQNRREFLKTLGLTAASFSGLATATAATSARRPPNLLFIALDDLNDWVGCLGGHPQVKTPHIDRLAKRGMVFTRAYTAAPICGPSRAAVFSGREPYNTGLYGNRNSMKKLRPDLLTMPQDFTARGYRTLGAGKLIHGGQSAYPEAFEEYGPGYNKWTPFTKEELTFTKKELAAGHKIPRHVVDRGPGGLKAVLPLNRMPSDRHPGTAEPESFDWGPVDVPDSDMSDYEIATWAVEKIREKPDKPFFLGVGFYRPHQPLFAPRKYHDMYPPESVVIPDVPADDLDDLSEIGKDFALLAVTSGLHETVVRHGQWRNAVSSYLACVSFVDAQVGRVLDALDESPHADNTAIVLWGDHGWHLGEKQHWGKFTGWERSCRVPLIVTPAKAARPSGFKPGGRCERPVGLIDLYPTLLDLCGLEPRKDLDGLSLAGLLEKPEARRRPAVTTFGRGNHSLRTPRWRYTRYYDGSEELYDHRADPDEFHNLAGEKKLAEIKKRLAGRLPEAPGVERFVRMGDWKAVLANDETKTELFDLKAEGGVGEDKNVAEKHPEILKKMREYIKKNRIETKCVRIPD